MFSKERFLGYISAYEKFFKPLERSEKGERWRWSNASTPGRIPSHLQQEKRGKHLSSISPSFPCINTRPCIAYRGFHQPEGEFFHQVNVTEIKTCFPLAFTRRNNRQQLHFESPQKVSISAAIQSLRRKERRKYNTDR